MIRLSVLVWLTLFPASVEAACRQALALGLDVSGSVDAQEYRLQTDGLANALEDPEVAEAFLAFPEAPVALFVFEWSGLNSQRVLQDWIDIRSLNDLAQVADRLRRTTRSEKDGATAVGEALEFGTAALANRRMCWRLVLDLSGDGASNVGVPPETIAFGAGLDRITVNGLVIGADAPAVGDLRQAEIGEIWAYYMTKVIRGPDAFVEVALGFQAFEAAMERKLLRELEPQAISALRP